MKTTTTALSLTTKNILAVHAETQAAAQRTAEKHMTAELRQISDIWAESGAKTSELSMIDQFQRSQDLKMIQDSRKFHDDSVKLMQIRHGLSKDTVKDYITVATYITEEEFAQIRKFNQQAGKHSKLSVSFTHLIRLARIGDDEVRLDLMRRMCEEGWTAEQLSEQATRLIAIDPEVGAAGTSQGLRPTAVTNKVQNKAQQLLDSLMPVGTEDFLKRFDSVKPKDMSTSLDNLRSTIATMEQLEEDLQGKIISLRSAEQRLEQQLMMAQAKAEGRAAAAASATPKAAAAKVKPKTTIPAEDASSAKPKVTTKPVAAKPKAASPAGDESSAATPTTKQVVVKAKIQPMTQTATAGQVGNKAKAVTTKLVLKRPVSTGGKPQANA